MKENLPKELWQQIETFEFDSHAGDYGFAIRLSDENAWSIAFTEEAIMEYKKFMFLAAVSDTMVSPSEIVDIVWHQHLIFTQSYSNFCKLLGKQIQHVPSTHNPEEALKFKLAKERTKLQYESFFGEQPANIWQQSEMLGSLNWPKGKLKIRSFLVIGVLLWILIFTPVYVVLLPHYLKIQNPWFAFLFLVVALLTFVLLEIYNRTQLKTILQKAHPASFVFKLDASEILYFRKNNLAENAHAIINNLIKKDHVTVSDEGYLETNNSYKSKDPLEEQVIYTLKDLGKLKYPIFLNELIHKPAFTNMQGLASSLNKYLHRSKYFLNLFYFNFGVLSSLLMLGAIRFASGFTHEKPLVFISMAMLLVLTLVIIYLNRLTNLMLRITLPSWYEQKLLKNEMQVSKQNDWDYFLYGNSALALPFVPMVKQVNEQSSQGGSCSAGDSSCGGGCGSSCGGCGGS